MRILHVNHRLEIGGTEFMMLALAKEQQALGHDVTICTMYGGGKLEGLAQENGLKVKKLGSRDGLLASVRTLSGYLRKNRYDVVNSHWGVWLTTALSGWISGTPRVHTHHANQMRRFFVEHRFASFFTDKVVSLTPEHDDYISKWVAVPKRKMAVITNGIELSRFADVAPAQLEGIPADSMVVGMVARLCAPKDYSTFLRAVKLIEDRMPSVHFVAVGNGVLEDEFKAEAAQLGLKRFHFLGQRLDVPAVLRRLSIKVLATRNEGLPISLLEAMASGCACIASDIPANRFTLADGKAGLLVEGQNPAALAAAIEELVNSPEKRQKLIRGAQERLQDFTSRRMAEDYVALYREVIGGEKRAGT